ncbi:MAG: aminopeptidase N [Pannonibacter phragmitetus]
MSSQENAIIRLEDYRAPEFRIPRISLDVHLAPHDTRIIAKLEIEPSSQNRSALVLDGDGLALLEVHLNGEPLDKDSYEASPSRFELKQTPQAPFTLTFVTCLNPEANSTLMGLYRSSGTYCTQCEAEGFRRITYFLDRPDVLSIYTTRIEANEAEAPVLLGNGNPVEHGRIEGTGRHYAVWHDPHPKPAYLFALVAGKLARLTETFTTRSGRAVELGIYVEPGKEHMCGWAMDSLRRSMIWDEEVFGLEYDLDVFNIVAVSDFNMGAMENKGLNIFNDKYVLADEETATDQDYAHVEAVIAHEYFHNWTGNRITCRDWFQLCLKEGLTVFRDQEFSSDMRSRPVKRIADVRLLRSHQFPEDAGPLAHPVRPRAYKEINNFYTATVYEKGAEIIRMLKTLLGAEAFRKGFDLYVERHDGTAATIEEFIACFAGASGRDLTQFARWYDHPGTPRLRADVHHDAATGRLTLTFTQELSKAAQDAGCNAFEIPVSFGLIGPDGRDLPLERGDGGPEGVLVLTEQRQSFTFEGIFDKPLPSLLRGFSAPVKLEAGLTPADLLMMLRKDSDPFNRWQAGQDLATRELMRLYEEARRGGTLACDMALVNALGDVLGNEDLDHAFRAQILALPGEADLARDIGSNVDTDAILAARKTLRQAIGRQHGARLADIVIRLDDGGPFRPDAASAGRRALKGLCLSYAAASGLPEAADLVARAVRSAGNMTDRLAALTAAVHEGLPVAEEALLSFEARHGGHALAMDKWFTVQATRPHPSALTTTDSLTHHAAFDWFNPNRVRALIGAFTTGNQSQFARADGAGFIFAAEAIKRLDPKNPQVAARLLTVFRSWKAYEPGRAALAEAALKSIAAQPGLSRDCSDIVERCLA